MLISPSEEADGFKNCKILFFKLFYGKELTFA
jgi:hypothetical protein